VLWQLHEVMFRPNGKFLYEILRGVELLLYGKLSGESSVMILLLTNDLFVQYCRPTFFFLGTSS